VGSAIHGGSLQQVGASALLGAVGTSIPGTRWFGKLFRY
jgi:hypothetical protein